MRWLRRHRYFFQETGQHSRLENPVFGRTLPERFRLGVFAKRKIEHGTTILDHLGPISVSVHQMTFQCYNCCEELKQLTHQLPCCPSLRYCSKKCMKLAEKYYHSALCGRDFGSLYATANQTNHHQPNSPSFFALIWLRILAICVTGATHPLQNPLFARLAPEYGAGNPATWTFEGDIKAPIKVLQMLGADIFTNRDYDMWVLNTLW